MGDDLTYYVRFSSPRFEYFSAGRSLPDMLPGLSVRTAMITMCDVVLRDPLVPTTSQHQVLLVPSTEPVGGLDQPVAGPSHSIAETSQPNELASIVEVDDTTATDSAPSDDAHVEGLVPSIDHTYFSNLSFEDMIVDVSDSDFSDY